MKTEGRPVATEMSVLVLVVLATLRTPPCAAQSTSECRYRYTEQPIRNLRCNPYTTGRLITACVVAYGPMDRAVDILWTFRPLNTSSTILISSEKHTITPGRSISVDSSRLQVNSLRESDSGSYACHIRFANDTRTVSSQQLDLFSMEVFSALQVDTCLQNEAQSEMTVKCAEIDNPPTTIATTDSTRDPTSTRAVSQGHGTSSIVASSLCAIAGFVVLVVQ